MQKYHFGGHSSVCIYIHVAGRSEENEKKETVMACNPSGVSFSYDRAKQMHLNSI